VIKIPFALAVVTLLFAGDTLAADGSINFTGRIIDAGCAIDTADMNQTVNLGVISKSAFASVGDTAAATRFSVRLTACPATLLSADMRFDGPADAIDNRLLAVNGGAAGVAVGIFENDSATLIPMRSRSTSVNLGAGNTGTLEFVAKYMATGAPNMIVAGDANATSQFTISYN
jgi:major type 1 subunit fimbrin (pilin)